MLQSYSFSCHVVAARRGSLCSDDFDEKQHQSLCHAEGLVLPMTLRACSFCIVGLQGRDFYVHHCLSTDRVAPDLGFPLG